ncbi:CD276 antigen-like isoform X2 [Hypanus sabinus]|nr:CD276 antigen-like isoform X2 [Hypanus sabinus]
MTMIYSFEDQVAEQYGHQVNSVGGVERGNLSIQINNVTPYDEGLYTCYIFKKQQLERSKIGECEVFLLVKANFSTPTIVGPNPERVQPGDVVNLTCHSSGGYPKPTVNWTDGENRPLLGTRQDDFSQDGVLRLWNISSMIQVKVSAKSSFACTVVNTRTNRSTTSPAWSVNTPAPTATPSPLVPTVPHVAIIVPCVVLCLIALVGLFLWLKLHCRYTGVPSKEVEVPPATNQIEMTEV